MAVSLRFLSGLMLASSLLGACAYGPLPGVGATSQLPVRALGAAKSATFRLEPAPSAPAAAVRRFEAEMADALALMRKNPAVTDAAYLPGRDVNRLTYGGKTIGFVLTAEARGSANLGGTGGATRMAMRVDRLFDDQGRFIISLGNTGNMDVGYGTTRTSRLQTLSGQDPDCSTAASPLSACFDSEMAPYRHVPPAPVVTARQRLGQSLPLAFTAHFPGYTWNQVNPALYWIDVRLQGKLIGHFISLNTSALSAERYVEDVVTHAWIGLDGEPQSAAYAAWLKPRTNERASLQPLNLETLK